MKKLLFVMVVMFMLAGGLVVADPLDWGGTFTFKLGANPKNLLFDHTLPAEFADASAALDVSLDENTIVHTSIAGLSGGDVTVGDTYLQQNWGFMTTKLGTTAYDSPGYATSNKEYESKTKGAGGPGIVAEIPIGYITIGAAKFFDSPFAIGAKYCNGPIDLLSIYYSGDVQSTGDQKFDRVIHSVAGAAKVIFGNFSTGAGIRIDDSIWSYGVGAKLAFAPSWIAMGVGVEDQAASFGIDTGLEFDKWGGLVSVGYIEGLDSINTNIWYKPTVVKYKLGYDYKPNEVADEVYIEVSADF